MSNAEFSELSLHIQKTGTKSGHQHHVPPNGNTSMPGQVSARAGHAAGGRVGFVALARGYYLAVLYADDILANRSAIMVLRWGFLGSGKIARDFACAMLAVDCFDIVSGGGDLAVSTLHVGLHFIVDA
eukprot:COSAG02_NODE_35982_length_460_cov_1.282548_1_plen_127_part_10